MASSETSLDLDSSSEFARQWFGLLAPHVEHALTATQCYTVDEVRSHLGFLSTYVGAWLGPAPESNARRGIGSKRALAPAYPSALTSDYTPLEFSYSWKTVDGESEGSIRPVTARFVTDIIPPDAQQTRSASLAAALQVIDRLRALASMTLLPPLENYGLCLFPDMWASVTSHLAKFEQEIHSPAPAAPSLQPCPQCCPSSTFIGFDLTRSHGYANAKAKLYWLLPSCQTVPALLALLDAIFALCIHEGHFARFRLPTFPDNWAKIRDYIAANSHSLRPRMLCLDATKYPFPRVKIYTRCYFKEDEPFDNLKAHLTLQGAIRLPVHFLDKCASLWSCLLENYKQNASPTPQKQPDSKYCMIVHEISPTSKEQPVADGKLASKLYLFCDKIPGHDAFVTQELLGRFKAPAAFWRGYVVSISLVLYLEAKT